MIGIVGWTGFPSTRSTHGGVAADVALADQIGRQMRGEIHPDQSSAAWTRGRETRPPYGHEVAS
jgi:hypothetical protein